MLAAVLLLCRYRPQDSDPYVISTAEHSAYTANHAGSLLATTGGNRVVKIWRISTTGALPELINAFCPPTAAPDPHNLFNRDIVSLSPDGKRLAVLLAGQPLRIYDGEGRRLQAQIPMPVNDPFSYFREGMVSWHPKDDVLLLSASRDIAFVETPNQTFRTIPVGGNLAWTEGGELVAGLTARGAALVRFSTGETIQAFEEPLETLDPLAISPDGKYLVTGGEDPKWSRPAGPTTEAGYFHRLTFKVWRTATGKRTNLVPGTYSNDENPRITFLTTRRIANLSDGDIYDIETARRVGKFDPPKPWAERNAVPIEDFNDPTKSRWIRLPSPPSLNTGLCFSSDSRWIATSGGGIAGKGEILLWDTRTGALVRRLRSPGGSTRSLRFTRDGHLVVNTLGELWIYPPNLTTAKVVKSPKPPHDPLLDSSTEPQEERASIQRLENDDYELTLLPDNLHAITQPNVSFGGILWRIDNRKIEGRLLPRATRYLAFSGDAQSVLDASYDNGSDRLVLRRVKGGQSIWQSPNGFRASAAEFSPDSRVIAALVEVPSPTHGHRLTILDAKTGKTLRTASLADYGSRVVFNAAGNQILVVGQNGIHLFRTSDLSVIAELDSALESQSVAAFSPDGRLVALVRLGKGVQILRAKTLKLLVTLLPFARQDWVAYTPSGAAAGSPGGLARLYTVNAQGAHHIAGSIRPTDITNALSIR